MVLQCVQKESTHPIANYSCDHLKRYSVSPPSRIYYPDALTDFLMILFQQPTIEIVFYLVKL